MMPHKDHFFTFNEHRECIICGKYFDQTYDDAHDHNNLDLPRCPKCVHSRLVRCIHCGQIFQSNNKDYDTSRGETCQTCIDIFNNDTKSVSYDNGKRIQCCACRKQDILFVPSNHPRDYLLCKTCSNALDNLKNDSRVHSHLNFAKTSKIRQKTHLSIREAIRTFIESEKKDNLYIYSPRIDHLELLTTSILEVLYFIKVEPQLNTDNEYIFKHIPNCVSYLSFVQLLQEIKENFANGNTSKETDEIQYYQQTNFLVVKGIENCKFNDWHRHVLYCLLDGRYSNKMPTIIISTLAPKDFARKVGDNIGKTIFHNSTIIDIS